MSENQNHVVTKARAPTAGKRSKITIVYIQIVAKGGAYIVITVGK